MEELTQAQDDIGKEIERLIRNFKKDPEIRKTSEYLTKKLDTLEEFWTDFEDNHSQIQDMADDHQGHPYFEKSFFEKVKMGYMTFQGELTRRLSKSKQDPSHQEAGPSTNAPGTSADASKPHGEPDAQQPKAGALSKDDVKLLGSSSKQQQPQFSFQENISGEQMDNTILKQLVKKQHAIMRALTHNLQEINSKDNMSLSETYCELKIQAINHYWADISANNGQIWSIAEDDEPFGYQFSYYSELEGWAHQTLIILQQNRRTNSQESTSRNAHVKLPKVTLPMFNGDYLKWTQFRELYVQMIHSQPLSKSEKMYYLNGNLVGEAKALIQHLPVSDQNYDTAWQILENRYDNKRLLVTAMLNKLFAQPIIVAETAQAIKSLHDTTKECILGIKNLGINTDNWDALLLHLLIKKVDRATHALYEQTLEHPRNIQPFNKFLSFLELRFQALEALGANKRYQSFEKRQGNRSSALVTTNKQGVKSSTAGTADNQKYTCKFCTKRHALYACQRFLKLSPAERQATVNKLQVCSNCLRDGHNLAKCVSRGCSKCQVKHNTLLHVDKPNQVQVADKVSQPSSESSIKGSISTNLAAHTKEELATSYVFLGTALIHARNKDGGYVTCRAILDSGSQLNFISTRLCKQLKLPLTKRDLHINGIGNCNLKANNRANIAIASIHTGYTTNMESFVIDDIAATQPQRFINVNSWPIPNNIKLADPEFNQPRKVDLLLGAELFPELLSTGQIKLHEQLPTLQNTVLGWIVLGKIANTTLSKPFCGISHAKTSIDDQLQRFWELEEVESLTPPMTSAERQCEMFFERTTTRNYSGRFMVRLPFNEKPEMLGNSKDLALRRFLSLEKKLIKNPGLKVQYVSFMNEYLKLNHMELAEEQHLTSPHYFIPHHCVLKPESSTTKLRVVFDASAKTTSNSSLNELLLKGPVLQDDLFAILLRFRMHKYVITGDIEKMYRQVLVHKDDRNFQLIYWRDEPERELQVFRLNTITYGTTPAPYLATKCLQTLAVQGEKRYPLGAKTILNDFYVDDMMSGSDSLRETLEIQQQTRKLLATAGFHLRKWCGNHPKLLKNVPREDIELELDLNDTEQQTKTLGLTWKPASDNFALRTTWTDSNRITKRTILAEIAQLFDPLGFVNPVVVKAKILLQRLWLLKLDWDSALPMGIHTEWSQFRKGLSILKELTVPRHVLVSDASTKNAQFHGFSDASEKAYAAAIYVRSVDKQCSISVHLLCAKSRAAPMKKQTLPRLELCAAKLLAQLMKQVQKSVQPSTSQLYFWTDSSIVLSWIRSDSSSFKTFVANRIATIHEYTDPKRWHHVRSEHNPADLGSRGTSPEELCISEIWFNGPEFLRKAESEWPKEKPITATKDDERKEMKTTLITSVSRNSIILEINHRNSFTFLQRTTAYILRFIQNLQVQRQHSKQKLSGPLNVDELQGAEECIIKAVQTSHFSAELKQLQKSGLLEARSKLAGLTPFIDKNGILRVGGRLQASNLKYDAKHPILVPHSHAITRLLLEYIHLKHLHAGPQALLAITRQRYWPLRGKTLASSIVHKCIRCARVKPKDINQLMGNLPPERVQPARPFTHVGVDFCGPIHIHYKLRGKRPTKAYIAVFVCFATKAVHLEIVSDLTTAAFIAALKRLIGRRGRPRKIFCDNATNFIGAKNELKEVRELVQGNEKEIAEHCLREQIQWCPIPPRSPHFGGLWESAVKSTKYHLVRVLMSTSPTYEELSTIIVEIEAILNSRPLTQLTDNPNDMQALTPGHFLIGEPLTSLSNSEPQAKYGTLSNRWEVIKNMRQEFWRRWTREYLQELQSRNKWKTLGMPIKPDMLVLIKEDNLPPLKWQLARVNKEHKGKDGLTRVVDLTTAKGGTITRAITKICPLPIENSDNEHEPDSSEQTIPTTTPKNNPPPTNILPLNQNDDSTRPVDHASVLSAIGQQQSVKTRRKRRIAPINAAWLSSPHLTKTSSQLAKYYRNCPTDSQIATAPVKNKKLKMGMAQTLVSLLFMVTLAIPALGQTLKTSVEIIPFTSKTGLYFEGLGHVHMISDDWNIIAYYDLEGYWRELNGLRNCLKQLTTLCQTLKAYEEYCTMTSSQLRHQLADIEHGNDVLLKINDPTTNIRTRRSPFNIIGSISNKLFGILDQEYADRMTKTIEIIENNENHLLDLIKNQTSVLDSTVNIMKKSEEHIHSQFIQINDYINQLATTVKNATNEVNEQRIMQIFNSLSVYTTLIIIGYERVQTALIEVFADTRTGRLNPSLITPTQLRKELSLIRENLPSSLSLPEQLLENSDTINLYNIMTVKARITAKHAIFSINIPLVNQETSELFHVVPVPMEMNNNTFIIQNIAEFLIVNLLHDNYFPMTNFDFRSCLRDSLDNYICRQHGTMYHKTAGNHQCELALLNQNRQLPTSCSIAPTFRKQSWIQLEKPNQWIYHFNKEVTVNIVCGKSSFRETLEGQGLLAFKANCLLRENMVTISSHNQHPNIIRSSFASSATLNTTAVELQQSLIGLDKLAISASSNITKDLQQLQDTIHQLKIQQHITSARNVNSPNVHHLSIAYLALILAVMFGIYFMVMKFRQLRIRGTKVGDNAGSHHPQPAPRQRNFEFQA